MYCGVLAVEAVFVFHLHHEDRAAAGDLQRAEHAADFVQVTFRCFEVARIARAQLDVVVLEQPPRQAAHLPLGARIRAGTQNHPEPFLLRDAAELRGVRLARPVEFAGPRLVHVPEQVGANGVQAHRLGHLQAMPPIFLRHTRRVDFAAADLKSLAVEQEIVCANGKGVFASVAWS